MKWEVTVGFGVEECHDPTYIFKRQFWETGEMAQCLIRALAVLVEDLGSQNNMVLPTITDSSSKGSNTLFDLRAGGIHDAHTIMKAKHFNT